MFLEAVGVWDFVQPVGKGVCISPSAVSCSRFRSRAAAGFSHPALGNPFGMSVFNYILSSAESILFNSLLAKAEHKGSEELLSSCQVLGVLRALRFPNPFINSKAGDLSAGLT